MNSVRKHIVNFCIWATLIIATWMPFSSFAQAPTCVGGISMTYSVTNATCNGANDGSVTVTITGATGNYLIFLISGNNPGQNFFSATVNTITFSGLKPDPFMQISAQASVGAGFGICNVMGLAITEPTAITNSPTITNPTCNGGATGSIASNISGGTPGYTYSWSNGATTSSISGLTAGSYTLTVTDANNCVMVFPYTITDPAAITATPTITNPTCFGGTNGSINISVSNGTAPYTYLWSNGATTQNISGVGAGAYSVTITDANSCTTSVGPFTVTAPIAVTAPAPTIVNVTCNGGNNGSIDITPSGGTAPYTYLWSNGATTQDITGLAASSYSLVLTDANGCPFNFGPYTVTQPTGVTVPAPTITNVNCNGGNNGAIDITPAGGVAPYTYTWSTGATTQDISGLAAGNYSVTIRDNNGCIFNFGPYTVAQPAVVSATATTVNILCNGGATGSIDLTPAGGTAPYTYLWSNGATTEDISGLSIGSYTVTVRDVNNCTVNAGPFTITQPTALSIPAPSIINVLCNGGSTGSIDISPAGGTLPYTYLWSNGATTQDLSGRPAGSYTVVLTDANGCTINGGPYTITQPTAITVPAPVITQLTCSGGNTGAIDITPNGGTAPYTYLWSNGFTTQDISGLSAGSYSVNIRDANNCNISAGPYTINPITAISVPAPVIVNVNCNGTSTGSIDITPAGGTAPYTYLWTNGATTQDISGLAAGSYSVTVRDANNCTFNAGPYTITQPTAISVPAPVIVNVTCNGASTGSIDITPAGGTAPYTYVWSNGATTQDVSGLAAGSYNVTVRDANNCTFNAGPYTITQPAAITVPAPVIVNINCNGGTTGSIDITPAGGTAPYTYLWTNGATTQDISGLAAGSYSVTITDANACSRNFGPYTITEPTAISVTGTPINITCNGAANGQITLSVSGGTAPYTYVWSNGATTQNLSGLGAGSYNVTVTDALGCTRAAGPFTITEPIALSVTGTATNALCSGVSTGSVDITPTGGTAPYTYSWSNGAVTQDLTNVANGSYTITITDANGCTTTGTYTVTVSLVVNVSLTPTDVSCFGGNNGSVTSSVSGGTAPYTYLWSNGATTANISGLTAGSYSLTVTDNVGCIANANATVNQPTAMVVTATTVNVTCNGASTGSIDLTVSGGVAPYTYLWSNGATTQDLTGITAGTYTVTVTSATSCSQNQSYTITEPAGMTLTVTPTNITCNSTANGQITLSVSGGTAPYSYLWSNGATTANLSGLAAGNYSVTVTDASGCSISDGPYTITEPAALTVTGTVTDALCSGINTGAIDITPAGGTAPYTYSWSNGASTQDITNVAPGSYTVTITDASGCITTGTYTINPSVIVSITLTPTDASCFGGSNGSVTSSVSGGTAPYTYLWSNGAITDNISGVIAGNYSLTVTDNSGCTATANTTVGEPVAMVITATTVDITCNGTSTGSIDLTVSGGVAPYTYLWSNGATTQDLTGITAGTYTVTVTGATSCTQNQSYTITEPTGISITATPVNITCNGEADGQITLVVSGGTAPYTYSWDNGATTQNLSGLSAGSYSVTITDASGCSLSDGPFTITEPAVLSVSGTTTDALCTGVNTGAVDITPAGGTAPYTYAWDNGASTQDLSNVAAGTYTVIITDANGCTTTDTYTVNPSVIVSVTLTPVDVNCFEGSDGSISSSVSGGTAPYTYSWSNGASTANINGLTAGSYTLDVTDNSGCTATATTIVNEPAGMTITAVLTNIPCSGGSTGSIDLSVSGGATPYTYNWSNGASTEDINSLVAGSYTVTITDANTCSQDSTFTLTQSTLSGTASVIDESCSSANGSIDFTPSGGTAPYTFSWSNGATTEDISGLVGGSYTVTYSDAGSCSDVLTVVVASIPLPNVTVTPAAPAVCEGGNVNLTASGALTYTWSPATDLSATTGATVTTTPSSTITYTVTGTDAGGCTNTATVTVTVNPTPTGSATAAPSTLCAGNPSVITAVLDAPATPAANAYSFDGGTTYQVGSTFNIPAINSDTTVNVVMQDINGCFTTNIPVSITLTHFQLTLVITEPSCNAGSDGSISVTNVTGGNAPYTYAINGGAFGATTTFNGLSAGSHTVSVTDNIGCRYDSTLTMNQPTVVALSAAVPIDSICSSSTSGIVNLTASGGTPAYTYSSDGVTFGSSSSFTTLAPGSYTFTVNDANGCGATATADIHSFPVVNTAGIIPIQQDLTCNGVNTGSIKLTNILGGTRPFMFSLDGGTPQTDSLFINLSGGPHTITIMDAKGCDYPYNFTINSPAPIDFDINIIKFETCNNADGILEITNVTGGVAPYTYSFNGGATAPYTGTVTQSNLVANTYTFTVNDASVPGCSLTKNVALPKKPGPIPYVRVNDAVCFDGATGSVVVDSVQGGVSPFQYYFNNTNFGGTTVFSNLSEGYYTVDIQDMECVYDIQTYYVWNPDSLYYDTLYNDSVYVGEGLPISGSTFSYNSANHLPTGTIGVYDLLNGTTPYQYSFDSLSFVTLVGDTILQSGLGQGTYPIFVVDSNGCTAKFTISIKDAFFIPNLITPNGDQANDYFEVVGLPADSELSIFDRWGQKIYHTDDYTNNWDGESNSDGVYYYELQLKSGALYKGWVQIVR